MQSSEQWIVSRDWYKEGLKFECTQCGNCCTGAPGYVWVNKEERTAIAQFLGNADGQLDEAYARRVGLRHSLTERDAGDCVFLKRTSDGKRTCSIYPVRPHQCRTWPFWHDNLRSPEAWESAAQGCPGMNKGKRHNFVAIEEVRRSNVWEGSSRWA